MATTFTQWSSDNITDKIIKKHTYNSGEYLYSNLLNTVLYQSTVVTVGLVNVFAADWLSGQLPNAKEMGEKIALGIQSNISDAIDISYNDDTFTFKIGSNEAKTVTIASGLAKRITITEIDIPDED